MDNLPSRIEQLERESARTQKDLYYGNGKPGLITRMEKMEDAVKTIADKLTERTRLENKFIFAIVMLMIANVIDLIFTHAK